MKKNQSNQKNELNEEEGLLELMKMINESNERVKNKTIRVIEELGEELINEIEEKREMMEEKKKNMIDYILEVDYPRNTQYIRPEGSDVEYCRNQLSGYSYEEIDLMYKKLKRKNRTFFQKIKDLLTLK